MNCQSLRIKPSAGTASNHILLAAWLDLTGSCAGAQYLEYMHQHVTDTTTVSRWAWLAGKVQSNTEALASASTRAALRLLLLLAVTPGKPTVTPSDQGAQRLRCDGVPHATWRPCCLASRTHSMNRHCVKAHLSDPCIMRAAACLQGGLQGAAADHAESCRPQQPHVVTERVQVWPFLGTKASHPVHEGRTCMLPSRPYA